MKFKIIGDSCCDFTKEELNKEYFISVPLTLSVGGIDVVDDRTFNQANFINLVEGCPDCPKSSCPSPESYMACFDDVENIFIVTISAKLSGSYNSAMLARQIYLEEHPEVNIHVFDSKTAAAGEHLICGMIEEYALQDLDFNQIIKKVDEFISTQRTIFVLENLEVMRKNGRLSKVKSLVASALNIKPVLYGKDGEIQQLDQARGMNKALNRLLWHIEKDGYDNSRRVEITQCDSRERCLNVRRILMERFGFKDVRILDAGGVSTMYESRGGVIVSF